MISAVAATAQDVDSCTGFMVRTTHWIVVRGIGCGKAATRLRPTADGGELALDDPSVVLIGIALTLANVLLGILFVAALRHHLRNGPD